MAIALGYGVLMATFITLFLVPSLYLIVEDANEMARALGRALGGEAESGGGTVTTQKRSL